ncbi:L-threonylcarbamoyladenylate synthase [Rubricella aquisinus]|uniref:Threonylcarbamoyl-AMP synthase n=1 Tax=Rubricella aquisinus TaxID=2028108 RepID=A0A840X5A7_9RHOB|nr:L-threonylcarbamoyladenylate synthase [Rubricella aquisinus]MBB5516976.1 L-threonylcarbamoyladenylate synthase [Rubricella aquisinus]
MTQEERHVTATRRLPPTDAGVAEAAALLAAGALVAFPSETVYGLGADARNGQAVAAIYAAKERPSFNPLIIHVPDLAAAERWGVFSPEARALALAFWPGALTLVVPKRDGLSDLVTAGGPMVAIRVPAHPLAQRLLRAADAPIAGPSANPSGRISPTRVQHVLDGLDGRIAAVLDGGDCTVGVESTIVGWRAGRACLLRAGGVPKEALEAALAGPLQDGEDLETPEAPGQLTSHYAPNGTVRLNALAPNADEVWLGFGPGVDGLNLSRTGDLAEAAANLFACLHALNDAKKIAVAPIPDQGLGRAINDRLRRAAAPR